VREFMNSVIIPAAGNSTRMGGNISKQFLKLLGREVIFYTIETFEKCSLINEIILVIKKDDIDNYELLISKYKFNKIKLVIGGNNRKESVYNGLQNISKNSKKILIHDGARPFINEEYIIEMIDFLDIEDAVVLAVKTKDTIKTINKGYINQTLDRSKLISVQTPQAFKKDVILKAYEYGIKNNSEVTDDSQLAEKIGIKVKILYGDYKNIKITTTEDIKFGEIILEEKML
jgi:2-C-methyl-D-erythritol 4-phosphate cytidylyltransferase